MIETIDLRTDVEKLKAELALLKAEFEEFKKFAEFELRQARRHSSAKAIHKAIEVKPMGGNFP